jgi:hypothetical protein
MIVWCSDLLWQPLLYYSTDGDNWSNDGGWLKSTNECNRGESAYDDLKCSQESIFQVLFLSNNNLSGLIPIEISLLTQLNYLTLPRNQLTGSIPSEFGPLTQLTQLILDNNELTGIMPSELALLAQLTWLILDDNELTGSIPSELALLTQLTRLWLIFNELTGSMPSSLCSAGDLTIYIDCGEIASCTCCRGLSDGGNFQSCPSPVSSSSSKPTPASLVFLLMVAVHLFE